MLLNKPNRSIYKKVKVYKNSNDLIDHDSIPKILSLNRNNIQTITLALSLLIITYPFASNAISFDPLNILSPDYWQYHLKYFLSGGIGCMISHGISVPFDVSSCLFSSILIL